MATPAHDRLRKANELLLSSRAFLAEEAANLGLINGVFPPGELMPYVLKYTRELISTVSPGSLRETKRQNLQRSARCGEA